MPGPAPIAIEHVTHAFSGGGAALADVSIDVAAGEFVSLVGPSGCGKSTLLRLVAGLLQPTRGQVRVGAAPAAPRVAFVFQDPTLLPWRTVRDNVRLPLELSAERAEQRIDEALALVGLRREDQGKFPRELSGGMRMRVSLARAMVTQPDVLLLDEPFAALDDLLRHELNEELLRLWQAQRWTALFVTHNVAEAAFLSQRVLVMSPRPGRIVADVAVPFTHPRWPELRSEASFAALTGKISGRLRSGAAA